MLKLYKSVLHSGNMLFKPSSDSCGVCRDQLKRQERPSRRYGSQNTCGRYPVLREQPPFAKSYNTSKVNSSTTSNICKWILQTKIVMGIFLTWLHMFSPCYCQKGHLIEYKTTQKHMQLNSGVIFESLFLPGCEQRLLCV